MTGEALYKAALQDGQIVKDRRHLHTHAQTGFDLAETAAYVKKQLTDAGYTPTACGKAGIVALAGGQKPGGVFLLRADMDALPMREEAAVDFSAKNGNMHACGHDMHTAMLLGAARLLKQHEAEIPGTVKLMFQPAEEILEGAHDMIAAGVLENPRPDAACMVHVMATVPSGTLLAPVAGMVAPAADYFTIKITGVGCHGAMPHLGVDPISTAAHILLALQHLPARELAAGDRAVLTICSFKAGEAANVIPDTAVMRGALRCFDEELRARLKQRICKIAASVAAAFRAKAEVTFDRGCPAFVNDEALAAACTGYAKAIPNCKVAPAQEGGSAAGSEDFAYISQQVPSVMLALGAGCGDFPQHHPKVVFDEGVLPLGSALYAQVALQWLRQH